MNPFKEFNHFIAYFVPGVVLFVISLSLISIIGGTNILVIFISSSSYIFVTLIVGTILGLLLDEFRHVCLEERFEKWWAKKNDIDTEKMDDFVNCAPKIGLDLYKLIRDEYFYFYEFDINISISLLLGAFALPFYLTHFCVLPQYAICLSCTLLMIMSIAFWYFGKNAYEYFLDVLKRAIDRVAEK